MPMAQTVIIKKYENRRLYDATNSRYVNLEEVAQLVQQGHDVQVVDAASGEDLTRLILTQIIAEGAKNLRIEFSPRYSPPNGDRLRPGQPGERNALHQSHAGSLQKHIPGHGSST